MGSTDGGPEQVWRAEAGLAVFEVGVLVRLGWTLTRVATLHDQPPRRSRGAEDSRGRLGGGHGYVAGGAREQAKRRVAVAMEFGEEMISGGQRVYSKMSKSMRFDKLCVRAWR